MSQTPPAGGFAHRPATTATSDEPNPTIRAWVPSVSATPDESRCCDGWSLAARTRRQDAGRGACRPVGDVAFWCDVGAGAGRVRVFASDGVDRGARSWRDAPGLAVAFVEASVAGGP